MPNTLKINEQITVGPQPSESELKNMGFECDKQELVEFVREYVDQHSAVSR